MPAPSPTQIQTFLTTGLIAKGFVKKTYVNGVLVVDSTQLPEELAKLVAGLANGMAQNWTAWQSAQAVVASDTITAAPVLACQDKHFLNIRKS